MIVNGQLDIERCVFRVNAFRQEHDQRDAVGDQHEEVHQNQLAGS